MYHNITPPVFLTDARVLAHYARLGLAQLDLLRGKVVTALADSEYNALELRARGYASPVACPFLFDVDELLAKTSTPRERLGKPLTVLFVGRIVASKGQAELVDAFAEFCKRWSGPARLVLVGRIAAADDAYVKQIKRRIAQHALTNQIILTGAVSDDELRHWYAQADLYVSLSLHEGFGVPLIEAMANRVPVIAWPSGAVAETLGGAATLLDNRDATTVAEAMLQLVTDQQAYSDQVGRQYRSLERFRLGKVLPVLTAALATAGACAANQNLDGHMPTHWRP
jgi:glycosyltransferase involved in cell wall biosynthesis